MMNNRFLWLIFLLPLLYSCQKYNKAPFDEYERILRTTKADDKGIIIDSLWDKRDSLSYLRLKNVKFMYLKSVNSIPKWITKFDSLEMISNTVDKSYLESFENIKNLKNLKTLDLSHSKIKEIQNNIFQIKSLEYLVFDENKIVNIPIEIKALQNLKSIHISQNPLINVPNQVCQLKKIESLIVEDTKITELPKCLGNLQNLEWINVSGTQLTEFPIEILNAPKLETIDARRLKLKNYKEVKTICEKKKINFHYDE